MSEALVGRVVDEPRIYELVKLPHGFDAFKIGTKFRVKARMEQDILMLDEIEGDGVLRIPAEALDECFK